MNMNQFLFVILLSFGIPTVISLIEESFNLKEVFIFGSIFLFISMCLLAVFGKKDEKEDEEDE